MSKYLEKLKAKIGNARTPEPVKTDKSQSAAGQGNGSVTADATFGSFDRSQSKPVSKTSILH